MAKPLPPSFPLQNYRQSRDTATVQATESLAELHHSRHAQVVGREQLRVDGMRDIEGERDLLDHASPHEDVVEAARRRGRARYGVVATGRGSFILSKSSGPRMESYIGLRGSELGGSS